MRSSWEVLLVVDTRDPLEAYRLAKSQQQGRVDDSYAGRVVEAAEISRALFESTLGPLRALLLDPSVENINVNPDGRIWIDRGSEGKKVADEPMGRTQREALIGLLANRQSASVDRLHSRLAGDLPYYDVRFQAFSPPIADWALCLRCHATTVRPLSTMIELFAPRPVPTRPQTQQKPAGYLDVFLGAIARGDNIAIVGRPGAGKTTLLNSALAHAAVVRPTARLVTLEDRRELKAAAADTLQLYARVEQAAPDNARYEYGFVDMLADALRTSFDVLAFGELRDGESALALLMALNCGTAGLMFTLHADSARDALGRLEDLVRLAGAPVIRRTIARFVHTLVYVEMDDDRQRRVSEIVRVRGVDGSDEYEIEDAA